MDKTNNNNENSEKYAREIRSLQARIVDLEKERGGYKEIEDKLRETRGELEIRVKVRTAELAKMNEDLHREILERRKIEDALRISEEKFRTIADFTYDWEYWQANDGSMVYISPSCERISGYKIEEFVEDKGLIIKIMHPDDQGVVKGAVVEAVERKIPLVMEFRIIRRDKAVRWMHHVCQPVFNAQGDVIGRRASNRDITDKKLVEESLANKERFLGSVFSSIQDGISVLDKDMNIIQVNSCMEKWYSHSMPLIGKKCYWAYHCSKTPCKVCPTRKTIATGSSAYEVVPKRGEGGQVLGWFDLYSFPLIDKNSGKMSGVIEYVRDITERKRAQDELRESEGKLRTILLSMADLVFGFDKDGRFTFCHTPSGDNNLYLPQDKFIGKKHSDVMPAKVNELFKSAFAKNKRNQVSGYEYSLKFKEDARWFSVKLSPVFNDGEFTGSVAVVRDITEYKLAQDEREKLNIELSCVNKRLKELSLTDPLTGLYNHRFLSEAIEAEFSRARRHAYPLAIIMLDIDYFKSINEIYGHLFGDNVLNQFAQKLKRLLRRYDIIARLSGEEFVVVLAGADRLAAMNLARRVLSRLGAYPFGNIKNTVRLKLSLSVVSYPEDSVGKSADLISLADRILSRVKEAGGNKVCSMLDIKKQPEADYRDVEDVKLLRGKIDKLNYKANQSLAEAIFAFAKTIEIRDYYTGKHVENTVNYAAGVAKTLGVPKDETELIKQAAALHDLGKIGISDKILLKKAKLTPAEFEKIKRHPQIGADILRPIHFLSAIIPLIFYHHERWDGKGYPSGLKGEDIPVGARIIAIADVYQALTSDRPYRKAYLKEQAVKIIRKSSGTQFDPKVVSAFLKVLKEAK